MTSTTSKGTPLRSIEDFKVGKLYKTTCNFIFESFSPSFIRETHTVWQGDVFMVLQPPQKRSYFDRDDLIIKCIVAGTDQVGWLILVNIFQSIDLKCITFYETNI